MTSDISVGIYKVKPNSVKWKVGVSNLIDTCVITLPLSPYIRNNGSNNTTDVGNAIVTETVFKEGDKVVVKIGYNNNNPLRFKGFIKQINYGVPLELVCEGYNIQLKDKYITKTYRQTTAKQILAELISETDIILSEYIADIPLKNITFKNAPAMKVLEWFQKECLCVVYFDFDKIFIGASKYGIPKATKRLCLGWNTASEKELKKEAPSDEVIINLIEKDKAGSVKRTKSEQRKYSSTKEVKVRAGLPDGYLKEAANRLQREENFNNYKGDVTAFLLPNFEKGDIADITDKRFPDREGKYFVEEINGSFDSNGGRQKLTLRYYGEVN